MEHSYKEYFGIIQPEKISKEISEGVIDPDTL
jgi:hypothetical protein